MNTTNTAQNTKNSVEIKKPLRSFSKAVSNVPVVTFVVDRIKEAIISGELGPGDYLPSETELTKNLGVGKSTVREAIKMLQAIGAVEVRRGQGTIIVENPGKNSINSLIFQLILQKGQPRDILDLRIMFEPPYTLMAMERATPEDIEKIAETVYSFETAIKEKRQKADHDLAFHLAILQSTRNPFVILIGETIYQLFYASLAKFLQTNPHDALTCHKGIFAAFYEKDSEKLQKEIINSFKFWQTAL